MTTPSHGPAPSEVESIAARTMATLTGGLVGGLLEVALALSIAALVFSGPLDAYVGVGIGLALVGTIAASTFIALRTSIPGIVAGIQEAPAAITAASAAAIAAMIGSTTGPERLLATTLTAIAVTTILTGLFFLVIGRFKLGNLIRFIPYPVIGGFMAGTGWLLLAGAFSLMTNSEYAVSVLLQADVLIQWLPGLVLALIFLIPSNQSDNPLVLPGLLILSTLLFWAIVFLSGATPAEVSAQGWLLGPFPGGGLWQPITPAILAQADWGVIASQAGSILAIFLISTAALLLNASGLEVATGEESDLNRELTVAGTANALAGLTGSLIVFQQLGISTLNHRLNAANRWAGIVSVAVCGLVLVFGASLLSLAPKIVIGGLLGYLGLSFLYEWTVKAWSRLPRLDYLIVLLILVVVALVGFLEGIALGLLVAVALFVVSYSRTDFVRHELSGQAYNSRVTRPFLQRDYLALQGDQILILELQGFLFFGTADSLQARVRALIAAAPAGHPYFMLLDFQRVTGLDSTAVISFRKLLQFTDSTAVTFLFTAVPSAIQRQFRAAGLLDNGSPVRIMADLDQGVEWCEEQLLHAAGLQDAGPATLHAQLSALLPDAAVVDELIGYFERQEIAAGTYLIQQAAPADELFIIESGRLTAQFEQPDTPPVRLETMGHSRVVGELGFYLQHDRTAAVVTVEDSVVYCLTRAQLARMEAVAPHAAAALHHLIIHLLAERVTHLMTAVDALQE